MNKDLQELVPGDAGTDGREDTQPMTTNLNLAEDEPVFAMESSMEPPQSPNNRSSIVPPIFHNSRGRSG